MVFISASNELGAFESGAQRRPRRRGAGRLLGGVLTVAVAVTWKRLFPQLAEVDRLDGLQPIEAAVIRRSIWTLRPWTGTMHSWTGLRRRQ